jgi:serine/threonine protein kinase
LLASSASDPTGLLDRLRAATEGEFVIVRELGRGGMGRVYLAHEIALDRRIALKVLPPALSDHPEIVQRFQREARTAGKLGHPHIVHVYQVLERGGLHFFTMPYVAGPDLRQVLKRTPQLSVELCLRYLCESAEALAFAHSHGVVHRDIKPENMLLEGSQDGRLLVTDFGIAKPLESASTITRPGDRVGTPYYMSPEQCEEKETIDGRSDQYSLGLVAYEMLAGRFPFTAESLAAMAYKHVHEYPEPLAALRPDVPDGLRLVIERAIRKDPGERYPAMGAMLEALQTVRRGDRVQPPAVPAPRSSDRSRRLGWRIGAVAAALVIVVIGVNLWRGRVPADLLSEAETPGAQGERETETGPAAFDVAPARPETGTGMVPGSGEATGGEGPRSAVSGGPAGGEYPAVTMPITSPELQRARLQAGEARIAAESARQLAVEQGADTLFANDFAAYAAQLAASVGDLEQGQVVAAAIGFAAARSGFVDLSDRIERFAAGREDAAVQRSGRPAVDDSLALGPAEEGLASGGDPAMETTPEDAIGSLLEIYRAAFEAEDLGRLREDVYRGPLPEADAGFFGLLFDSAEQFDVTIEVEELTIEGDEAGARIRQAMAYQLSVTHEARDHELRLDMVFQRTNSLWRLIRLEQR